MQIAIDASCAAAPRRSGIGVYVINLLDALAKTDSANSYVICYRLSRLKYWRWLYCPPAPNFRIRILQEPLLFPRKADVFHCAETRLPRCKVTPTTVCAHADWVFSDQTGSDSFKRKRMVRYREVAERADVVIANSESTRRYMIEQAGVKPSAITIVHYGISQAFHPCSAERVVQTRAKYGLPDPYCIAVASFSKRKNVHRILGAYAALRSAGRIESTLVLVGSLEHWKEAGEVISRLGLDGKLVITGHLPNEELPAIYTGARMLVFPSLAEGFGLPILEAMACGTPVITSNRSSMPEVVGDAGILVDPENEGELAERMSELDGNQELRSRLSRLGLDRAKLFTWEKTAERMLAVWRELVR